jgi:3alpha(or 20beta)-hydroxysteroid dehydrogenase
MGASHARGLVAEGAKVVIGDVLVDEGEALAEGARRAAKFVKLDVTQEHDWEAAVAAAEALGGPLNLLVNNAGIVTPTAPSPTCRRRTSTR